jgi:hypothetical protein
MNEIRLDEVTFHPHSFGDPAGRIFSWRGDLYRAITPASAPFLTSLLYEPVARQLMAEGLLIESEIVPLSFPPYATVIRHPRIRFPSYAEEWCPAMLKDGALAVLELASRLADAGLMLKDAHCWNLLFAGPRPVYVDLTSIVPMNAAVYWPAYDEFMRFFVNPLRLMEHGLDRVARRLLPHGKGVLASDLAACCSGGRPGPFALIKQKAAGIISRRRTWAGRIVRRRKHLSMFRGPAPPSFRDQLRATRRDVELITLPAYGGPGRFGRRIRRDGTPPWIESRARQLRQTVDRLGPTSIVVVEDRSGVAPQLARLAGVDTTSFSTDLEAVTLEYGIARRDRLPLLPLVLNFVDPTPSRGIDSHSTIAAHERLQGQLVIAPGSMPSIARELNLRIDQVVRGLITFSSRWLIFDGVPSYSSGNGNGKVPGTGWSIEALTPVLENYFRDVDVLSIEGSDEVVVVCEDPVRSTIPWDRRQS